jgi:hypothetical protein
VKKTTLLVALLALVGVGTFVVATSTRAASTPNLKEAIQAQQLRLLENPNDAQAHNDLGNLWLLAQSPERAEESYREALVHDPSISSARYNLALLLQEQGKTGKALDQLKTAREQDPTNAWVHYQIGAILDAQGDTSRAVRSYARAFALDPQLAFPEVNPQVIDNQHLTRALLIAYDETETSPEATYLYENPGRIAAVMVHEEESERLGDDPDENVLTTDQGEGDDSRTATEMMIDRSARGGSGTVPSSAVRGGGSTDPTTAGQRVLRSEDLERGRSVNQASPGDRRTSGSRGAGAVIYQGGQRTGGDQVGAGRNTGNQGREPGSQVAPQGQPRYVPPPTQRIRTGTDSTGRLDSNWLPHRETKDERVAG